MLNTGIFQDKLNIAKVCPIKSMVILKKGIRKQLYEFFQVPNYFITVNTDLGQSIQQNLHL